MGVPTIPETMAAEAISSLIKGCTDYLVCQEKEKTERERIEAALEVALVQINAQFDLYEQALRNSHEQFMIVVDSINQMISSPTATEGMIRVALQCLQNMYYKASDERMRSLQNAMSGGQDFGMRRLK